MTVICIKQQISNILSSINERVEKNVAYKKGV